MPRKPAHDWKFFPCQIGNDVAFIFVDVGASETIQNAPRTLVKIRLVYKAPRANGLPASEEFETARAIEKSIEHFARGGDRYVGRITRGGHRDFYVYTTRARSIWGAFVDKLVHKSGYQLKLAVRSDVRHAGYTRELYPTRDDWQVIGDIGVIEVLRREGDMENIKRRIDHWSYFKDAKSAAKFVAWAITGPHKHVAKLSGVDDDGEHCVRLYHVGTTGQRDLSHHTIQLNRKAAELGGRYDGWETQVVKRKRAKP